MKDKRNPHGMIKDIAMGCDFCFKKIANAKIECKNGEDLFICNGCIEARDTTPVTVVDI